MFREALQRLRGCQGLGPQPSRALNRTKGTISGRTTYSTKTCRILLLVAKKGAHSSGLYAFLPEVFDFATCAAKSTRTRTRVSSDDQSQTSRICTPVAGRSVSVPDMGKVHSNDSATSRRRRRYSVGRTWSQFLMLTHQFRTESLTMGGKFACMTGAGGGI